MSTTIQPTEAELEFLRLKREQEEIQKQQEALAEQLKKDKEAREEQFNLQKAVSKNQEDNMRIDSYYQILCVAGCSDYVKLEKENFTIKSSTYSDNPLTEESFRYRIKIGNYTIYSVDPSDNKAECYSITGSYRNYTATGMAKKILEKIAEENQKKTTANKLEQTKRDLVIYFTETSPEGTVITTRQDYKSYYDYGRRRNAGGYYVNIIKLEYPNKSWVDINYYEDGKWVISNKFDSHTPKFDTKEEWLEYLKN